MDMHDRSGSQSHSRWATSATPMSRRSLLRGAARTGAAVAGVAVCTPLIAMLTACSDDIVNPSEHATITLGTELGALNLAYALAQMEQDFYQRIIPNLYPGMLATEASAFTAFASSTLGQMNGIRGMIPHGRIGDAMTFRFAQLVNFADRTNVLTHSTTIAATTLGGYVSVRTYLSTPDYVTAADEWIMSAEDRATRIRAMVGNADPVTPTAIPPADVMDVLKPYYQTTITLRNV